MKEHVNDILEYLEVLTTASYAGVVLECLTSMRDDISNHPEKMFGMETLIKQTLLTNSKQSRRARCQHGGEGVRGRGSGRLVVWE